MRVAVVLVVALGAASPAAAQPAAAAEVAFREGRRLMGESKYAEACPYFEESQRLDPAPGTQLNLGDCYEKLGRVASAWNAFVAADTAATRAGQRGRADEARRRAAAVEPRLGRVVIQVPAKPAGLVVRIDGNEVTSLVGVGIPLDPGSHAITATAPGHREWTATQVIAVGPTTTTVTIALAAGEPRRPEPPQPEQPAPITGSGRRMTPLTWSLVGGGAAVLAIGVALDVSAYGDYNTCRDQGGCPDAEVDRIDRRLLLGDLAIGAGIVAAAVGVTLYVLSDRKRESPITVGVDPHARALLVRGAF